MINSKLQTKAYRPNAHLLYIVMHYNNGNNGNINNFTTLITQTQV